MTTKPAALALAHWRVRPVRWVKDIFNEDPWSFQCGILDAVRDHKEVAVRSCHGVGKDWIASRVALWFLTLWPDSMVITTAPTERQVRGILWKEIGAAYGRARARGFDFGGTLSTDALRLGPAWMALGFTAPEYDPNKFQGFHARDVLVIKDEASGISPDISEAIDGVLTSENARLLEIGNPTDPTSSFAKMFKIAAVKKFACSVFDTPNFAEFGIIEADLESGEWLRKIDGRKLPRPYLVTPEWAAKRLERWGKDSPRYQARVLGQFPSASSDGLISLAWVEAACARPLHDIPPRILGVDVARFGDDSSTAVLRCGNSARVIDRWAKRDTMATVGRVAALARAEGADAIHVDVIGVGAGVVDRLQELGLPVVGANAAASPGDPERFKNARAEWFWHLREALEQGSLALEEDDLLVDELTALKWKHTSEGKIQIEAKEDLKKRIGRSCDAADALALAFATGGFADGGIYFT